jgi:hypothetical protein
VHHYDELRRLMSTVLAICQLRGARE